MTAKILEEIGTLAEQRLILPGYYTWEQFEAIESLMADSPGLRITYLDGWIEFMTVGEEHEQLKVFGYISRTYFFEKGNEFIPVGSATRRIPGKRCII
jgi:Uma2 family endonuclease